MTPPLPTSFNLLKPSNIELLTSETRAQQLLEAVPVGIMVFDANGKIYYTNKTAQQTLNHSFSLQERDGSAVHLSPFIEDYSLYLAGTQQPYPTATHPCKRVLQGETITADDIELHLGDHIIPLEVWATPIFDEYQQVSYAIMAFRDISERKQAQRMQQRYTAELAELTLRLKDSFQATQHSEQKLAQFLDALPVGVAVLEADGRSAYINRRAQQLLGKDIVTEVITDSDAEVYPVYLAGSDQPYPSMNQPAILALQGQTATVDNMEIHQPDKIIPIEVWATPIFNDKQEVNYAIVAFQDISERKRAQVTQDQYTQDLANLNTQLEEYTRSLEQKMEERTAALVAQTEEANRANQSKTRFLAAASHDLRQPLHALRLFIDVLENRLAEDHAVRPLVQKIQQTVAVMASLFEALLDISRLDAGAVQPELKSFDLWILFKHLLDGFQSAATQKGLSLQFDQCDQVVYSDPVLLEQILRNLIENALKYTPQGAIRVSAQTTRLASTQESLEITVTDTGIGIPEDQQEEVFLEFHQLHNPERDRLKGLGLGLSIVKRLAQLLGHSLQLTSRVGEGTQFTLTVPVGQPTVATTDRGETTLVREEELMSETVTVGRILVIDDEPFIRKATKMQLTVWGYEVLTAASTAQAIQEMAITAFVPQVIIADYHLRNNETGDQAIQAIQTSLGKMIPGIIITGDTTVAPVQVAKTLDYKLLHKPVKPAHLRKLINYCLRQPVLEKD